MFVGISPCTRVPYTPGMHWHGDCFNRALSLFYVFFLSYLSTYKGIGLIIFERIPYGTAVGLKTVMGITGQPILRDDEIPSEELSDYSLTSS